MSNQYRKSTNWLSLALATALVLVPFSSLAQTKITYHANKFNPQDDVRLGRQAAAEVEQQLPLLRDAEVTAYVEHVGQRLVASIPPEFQHPEFRYYFKVVNASDINAFALPGGPMYVNRGMIEAAHNEGEMAGVMAHELSHVALRHGTAQATKAEKYQVAGGVAGVLGTILGGPALGQLAQLPIGAYFLKYSREYETEADVLGARIMANAGYDPRDLANMFRTIQAQGGGGGGFLSDHPSPKDRYERISQEAQYLKVANANLDNREFYAIKERLSGYPQAQTMAQIQQSGARYPNGSGNRYPNNDPNNYPNNNPGNNPNNYPDAPPRGNPGYPSSRYRTYDELGFVRLNVPDNWREVPNQNSVWFTPSGPYGSSGNGQSVFTHGVQIGLAQTRYRNLQQATNDFINGLQQTNGNLRARSGYQRMDIDGRYGQVISMDNVNESTGRRELVNVATTQLRNGQLFYLVTVCPENEYSTYQNSFLAIMRSIRLSD